MRSFVVALAIVLAAAQTSTTIDTTTDTTTAASTQTTTQPAATTVDTTTSVDTTTTPPATTVASTTTPPATVPSTTTEASSTTVASSTTLTSTTTAPPTVASTTTLASTTVASTTTAPPTVASTTVPPTTASPTVASTTVATTATPTTSAGACPIASAPSGVSGATYTVTFALDFATFNCASTFAAWTQLWNRALPLRLLSATAGSVVFRIFADDNGTPGAAQARFDALAVALKDPQSTESRQAVVLGIPVQSTSQDTAVNVGLIVGAVVGALLLIALVILIVVLVMRHRRGRLGFSRFDDKLSVQLLDKSQPASHDPVIGSPFNLTHDKGESQVLTRLVSLNDAKARRDSDLLLPDAAAGAAIGGGGAAGASMRRFRLLADIRDVGEAVLTGARMGTQGTVEVADLTTSDWIWATLEGRSGWVPRNHMQME